MPRKPAATPKATRSAAAADKSEMAVLKELVLAVTASNTQFNKRLDRMDADRIADKAAAASATAPGEEAAGTSAQATPAPRPTKGRKKKQPPPQVIPQEADITDHVREEVSTLYTRSKKQLPDHFVDFSSSEEEEEAPQPQVKHKSKTNKSKFTHWPSDYVFDTTGTRVAYQDLSSEQFYMGYLAAIRRSHASLKDIMLHHLEMLSQDIVQFQFNTVRSFHAIWLQGIEEGEVSWADNTERDAMRRRFIWNAPNTKAGRSQQYSSITAQARPYGQFAPVVPLAPNSSPCTAFNSGSCSFLASHAGNEHICTFCASRYQRSCTHSEMSCIKKRKAGAQKGKNF